MVKGELRAKLKALLLAAREKSGFTGAGETGHLVKFLPLKYRDLSLDHHPTTLPLKASRNCVPIIAGGARQRWTDSWGLITK